MKPFEFPLLADENVHPAVVAGLRARGSAVHTLAEVGLLGAGDEGVVASAHTLGQVVLTHDHDFGRMAIATGAPYCGIVFVRPGHIRAEFVLETIDAARLAIGDVTAPFLVTVERRVDRVRIRVR